MDLNHRRHSQRIYSPSPLTTRAPLQNIWSAGRELNPQRLPGGTRFTIWHDTTDSRLLQKLVDRAGVGPAAQPCKGCVFPLTPSAQDKHIRLSTSNYGQRRTDINYKLFNNFLGVKTFASYIHTPSTILRCLLI